MRTAIKADFLSSKSFLLKTIVNKGITRDFRSLFVTYTQFQYMERRVSVYGTQGFSTWNAQSQAMKTLFIGSLFKAFVRHFKGEADVFLGIRNRLGIK